MGALDSDGSITPEKSIWFKPQITNFQMWNRGRVHAFAPLIINSVLEDLYFICPLSKIGILNM